MLDKSLKESISKYRLEKAEEMLADAELLFGQQRYASSNNRAYYAVFNAMRAVLALDAVEFKKHSGNIQYFLKEYVKTGVFDTEASEIILASSKARNDSDYDDFYEPDEEEARQQIDGARKFLEQVSTYLETLEKV